MTGQFDETGFDLDVAGRVDVTCVVNAQALKVASRRSQKRGDVEPCGPRDLEAAVLDAERLRTDWWCRVANPVGCFGRVAFLKSLTLKFTGENSNLTRLRKESYFRFGFDPAVKLRSRRPEFGESPGRNEPLPGDRCHQASRNARGGVLVFPIDDQDASAAPQKLPGERCAGKALSDDHAVISVVGHRRGDPS